MPSGAAARSSSAQRTGPVVERGVEAELVPQVGHLVVRSGAPDHAVAADLRHLRDEAPDRAGGGRDPDDVALAQARDVEETHVGGEAAAAERAEIGLRRSGIGVHAHQGSDAAQLGPPGLDQRVVAPPGRVTHRVAGLESVGTRRHDLTDGRDPVHGAPEGERREVAGGRLLAQPQPVSGVDRRPRVAHEHLAGPRVGYVNVDDAEVRLAHLAPRIADEVDLAPGQRVPIHARAPPSTG